VQSPRGNNTRDAVVTLAGTGRGDGLARIAYSVNDGPENVAEGTENWSANVELQPGVNRITVIAEAEDGTRSRTVRKLLRLRPRR
jgi:hypothetical protein